MHREDNASPDWRVYTRQQAAAHLHVPVSQIDAAIKGGELAAFRIGKHTRITDAALRRFVGLDEPVSA